MAALFSFAFNMLPYQLQRKYQASYWKFIFLPTTSNPSLCCLYYGGSFPMSIKNKNNPPHL
jgi:hypothetical protein